MLRIGVIGVGLIGALHARLYAADPRTDLVAVCDADADRAQALAAELGCAVAADWPALLAHDLDAVSLCTPEQLRFEPAVAAARKGLHLMLEKPLGRTLADVDRLVDALQAEGADPAVNFILHGDLRFARMKEVVAAGEIGQIATCFARRRGSTLGIEKYAPWTDLLSSTLIHEIEMCLSINPAPPVRVFAEAVVRRCAPYGCHDAVMATLRFDDGAIASFETSWVLPPGQPEPLDPAFHVLGDAGLVAIEGSSNGMRVLSSRTGYGHPDVTHWPMLPWGVDGALRRSLEQFVSNVLAGRPPLVGLAAARRAEAVVAAMKASIDSGQPERVAT